MDKKSNGFTLIELIVVMGILGIVAAVAVSRLIGFKSKAKDGVCTANQKTVERMYSAYLLENDMDYSDSIFNQFLVENFDEICPAGGVISCEDGKVKCSVHDSESEGEEDEESGAEVPWL